MLTHQDFEAEPNTNELLVRFAYWLIVRDYHANPARYTHPQQGIHSLRMRVKGPDFDLLDFFLCGYQYLVARRVPLKFARTGMIERARQGVDFRSVVFIDYKAHRRPDPPVSNTGVGGSGTTTNQVQ